MFFTFTTLIHCSYEKSLLQIRFMPVSEITQIAAHGWNVAEGHKGIAAA